MKKNSILKKIIIIQLICFVLFFGLHLLKAFQIFENKAYDQQMQSTAKFFPPADDVAFIEVNQASLDWALENRGWSWPWPREAYAQIIDFLSAGNVKTIAFDMLYTEPSIYGPEDDECLGKSEEKSGRVIQTVFIRNIDDESEEEEALFPVDVIKENAAALGNVISIKDSDDMIRRARISYNLNGVDYPSLGFAPLYFTENTEKFSSIPTLKDGSVYLRYRENLNAYFPYQACDILESYDAWINGEEGELVPEDFNDLYVFFALYAPGLFDICSSPVSKVYPGVGVHITALDNYLTDSFMKKTPVWSEFLWFFVLSMLGGALIFLSTKIKNQAGSICFISIGFVLGVLVSILVPIGLFFLNIWLVVIGPVLCFIASFISALILSFNQEGKQKRFIKSAFSQCLSKEVVQQILENPDSFTLGGKKYQMSALFTDIEKFSSFSELLSASELGALLNYYLTKMSDIIIEEKGTIDKYEGDAIVALVGAPVEMQDHGKQACRAAIRMKKSEVEMNEEIQKIGQLKEKPADMDEDLYNAFVLMRKNQKKFFTRIGINSGEMIAGYFGSEKKKNYTMMGNNVNLASRLEGVNKQYHTNGILISGETRNLLDEKFLVRSLDKIRVVNVEKPIQLYEVLDLTENVDEKMKDYVLTWEDAMVAYNQRDYEKANVLFQKLKTENPDDKVLLYYMFLMENFFLKGKYPEEKDDVGVAFLPKEGIFKLLQK